MQNVLWRPLIANFRIPHCGGWSPHCRAGTLNLKHLQGIIVKLALMCVELCDSLEKNIYTPNLTHGRAQSPVCSPLDVPLVKISDLLVHS